MSTYETKMVEAEKVLHKALDARIQAGNAAAIDALRNLITWVPEGGFPLEKGVYDEDPNDKEYPLHEAPVCTEAYAYALWGKGDARSFLSLVGAVAKALGVPGGWRDLQR